ncbi:hypothetical protein [Gilliamella sp. M0320]|nr:hypothetical protein [Gilliamella sp. M0320]
MLTSLSCQHIANVAPQNHFLSPTSSTSTPLPWQVNDCLMS